MALSIPLWAPDLSPKWYIIEIRMGLLTQTLRILSDILVPPRKTEKIVRALSFETLLSLRKTHTVGEVEALLPYENEKVQALIWELKYYGSAKSASLLGRLLAEEIPALVSESLTKKPLLIPVPLHPNRIKARGYNQMTRVTEVTTEQITDAVEHAPDILVRIKDTPRQTALSRTKRLLNVVDAFKTKNPTAVKGRVCIVVDDVATTGSTLLSAGSALKKAGASSVVLLALASAR